MSNGGARRRLAAALQPAFLKIGMYGHAGSGKTYTACRMLSEFIAEFCPGRHLAMFDSEGGAGYVAPMVKQITGRDLLVVTGQAFSELLEFAGECREDGHIALVDSATHPWRSLCLDYLEAKRSRVAGAGGNAETTKLSLKDWGPIKDMWAVFANRYRYDPIHWCICGREGDTWATVTDEEGNEELRKDGTRMKTETETAYEPSLLIRMVQHTHPSGKLVHTAEVVKDRFDVLTGARCDDPGLAFFRPHIELLGLGGRQAVPDPEAAPAFEAGAGKSYRTIAAERAGILENIKDDLLLAWPGQTAVEKKAKVEALRACFGTSSWSELEHDDGKYPPETLREGRTSLAEYVNTLEKT